MDSKYLTIQAVQLVPISSVQQQNFLMLHGQTWAISYASFTILVVQLVRFSSLDIQQHKRLFFVNSGQRTSTGLFIHSWHAQRANYSNKTDDDGHFLQHLLPWSSNDNQQTKETTILAIICRLHTTSFCAFSSALDFPYRPCSIIAYVELRHNLRA